MKVRFFIPVLLFLPTLISAQNKDSYVSNVVKTNRLTVEYMDFGGEGTPLIVIQGAHNYFDTSSQIEFIRHSNKSWIDFYSAFSQNYHVLAPLKRGFGNTDSQLENETVQTGTEDLISLMDHLKIQKAFFIGRDVPAQNMLYLAENHPDRVLGLVFIQPVFGINEIKDEASNEFIFFSYTESYSASEFRKFKLQKPAPYRPQIFTDSTRKLNVPALLFYHHHFSETTLVMRRVEQFIKWVESGEKINWENEYSSAEIAHYFEKLSKDRERMYHIRHYLKENNQLPNMNKSLVRAFNNNLVVFNESPMQVTDVRDALMNVYLPVVRAFLYMTNAK